MKFIALSNTLQQDIRQFLCIYSCIKRQSVEKVGVQFDNGDNVTLVMLSFLAFEEDVLPYF